jgi:hypothetical protein
MSAGVKIERTHEQCMSIGRERTQSGHHEVAYHAWMAALHCAEDAENESWASELIGMFRDHQRVGAWTADALVKRIENKRKTEESRRRTGAK